MDNQNTVSSEASDNELIALSRVLVYARDEARSVGVATVEHCVEMALQAVRQELHARNGNDIHILQRFLNIETLQ